jgi:heptosyltransferase II
MAQSSTTKTVLIVAPAWVGDAVMSAPLIEALASEGAKISVLASRTVSPIYQAMPCISELIDNPFAHGKLALKARWQLARSLKGQFTHAYILPNSLKSALIPLFAGIPNRIGFVGEQRYGLLTEARKPKPLRDARLIQKNLSLSWSQEAYERNLNTPLNPPKLAVKAGQTIPKNSIALCPGAEFGPAKQWPASHHAALANQLIASAHPVYLLGSPADKAIATEIAQAAPNIINTVGQTTLTEAMQLLAQMQVVIANDSGLLHIADALGRPTIGLFGSTTPTYSAPAGREAKTITLNLACSPCHARTCPLGHLNCLKQLTPDMVLQKIS